MDPACFIKRNLKQKQKLNKNKNLIQIFIYLTPDDTAKNGRVENDGPSTECIRRVAREETREDAAQIKEHLCQVFKRLSITNEVPLGDERVAAWDRVYPVAGAISVARGDGRRGFVDGIVEKHWRPCYHRRYHRWADILGNLDTVDIADAVAAAAVAGTAFAVAMEFGRVGHHGIAEKHEGSCKVRSVKHEENAQRIPTADSQVLVQTIQLLTAHNFLLSEG